MVAVVKIDVEFVIVAVDDSEAICNVLTERAGHESLLRVEIGIGVVWGKGISLVNRYLVEEEGVDEVWRHPQDAVLRKEQLGAVRNHYLLHSLARHILVQGDSHVGPILHSIHFTQKTIVELTVNHASHLHVAPPLLQQLIVYRL